MNLYSTIFAVVLILGGLFTLTPTITKNYKDPTLMCYGTSKWLIPGMLFCTAIALIIFGKY